jgi:hypothetical protein|nr:MAG TPA: Vascular endothelial growth factor receptor [Caudoviricetes sp.]
MKFMSLTPEEEREMYADIKVIKNNCARCLECQKEHGERLTQLEQDVTILKEDKKITSLVCSGVGALIMWLLSNLFSFFKG